MTTNNAYDMKPMTVEEWEELEVKIRAFLGIDEDVEILEVLDHLVARLMRENDNAQRMVEIQLVKRMELEDEVKRLRKKNKKLKKRLNGIYE